MIITETVSFGNKHAEQQAQSRQRAEPSALGGDRAYVVQECPGPDRLVNPRGWL